MSDPLTRNNARSENPAALDSRARFNSERGSFDLGAWVRVHAAIGPHDHLLDVGCGTGKLLLRYGESAMGHGRCVALDISEPSLQELQKAVRKSGHVRLETRCLDMDSLASPTAHPDLHGFKHIVSAYALYYSTDPQRLLEGLCRRLRHDGTLLIVAPAPGNNAAWFDFLERAGARVPQRIRDLSESFLEDVVLPFGVRHFGRIQVEVAENTVRFASAAEIDTYWRSNIYFDPAASAGVKACAGEVYRGTDSFTNVKRIGLVAMHGRVRR